MDELEKQLLPIKIKTFRFWAALFLGMAAEVGLIHLRIGYLTPLAVEGIVWLAIALGSYQYSNHLMNKFREAMKEEKGEDNAGQR